MSKKLQKILSIESSIDDLYEALSLEDQCSKKSVKIKKEIQKLKKKLNEITKGDQ